MTLEISNSLQTCYIGIGSNLANPVAQVNAAIEKLQQLKNSRWRYVSALYRSAPVGPAGQDDYINAVACFETRLAPEQLLDALQQIENSQQRVRRERWGARTLDLDILLIGEQLIDTSRLTIPHPYITQRNFVLVPLAEIAPELTIKDVPIGNLIKLCPVGALEKISI